jgi:hypothetical protein
VDGYAWIEARPKDKPESPAEWYITGNLSRERSGLYVERFDPMDQKTLYREFVGLKETDRQAIAAFGDKYGLLGLDEPIVKPDGSKLSVPFAEGESWGKWKQAIVDLRKASRLRDAIADRDRAYLRKHFTRCDDQLDPKKKRPRGPGWENTTGAPVWFLNDEFERDVTDAGGNMADVYAAASLVLVRWVNARLKEVVRSELACVVDTGEIDLIHKPKHLLSALWLHLAEAAAGCPEYRQCRQCKGWFDVAEKNPNTGRKTHSNQIYCTNACKSLAYRTRRDRPRRGRTVARKIGPAGR